MLLLAIETASQVCSVALAMDGKVVCTRESDAPNIHSTILTSFIDELLHEANVEPANLDAIAVSSGPGSYTGLRIGVATAKGLCFALGKPLIAIPTLQGMALGMRQAYPHSGEVIYCPMLDARRMEVYCALFDDKLEMVGETEAKIIDENAFSDLLSAGRIIFAGEGAEKCTPMLAIHPNAEFLNGFRCAASFLIPLAMKKYLNHLFEDIAYFEPFYLKDFIAGIPKVKGLKPTSEKQPK